jgi:hypothetical protein
MKIRFGMIKVSGGRSSRRGLRLVQATIVMLVALLFGQGAPEPAHGVSCPEIGNYVPSLTLCHALQPSPLGGFWTERGTRQRFDSCNAFQQFIDGDNAMGVYLDTRRYYVPALPSPTFVEPDAYTYAIQYKVKNARIELTEATWPNMTEFQRKRLAEVQAALWEHERGHANLTGWMAARESGLVTLQARSLSQARKAITKYLDVYLSQLGTYEEEVQGFYDEFTSHGFDQELIGGASTAVFQCEPKLTITPTQLPAGVVNEPYNQPLQLLSLEPDYVVSQPVTWSVIEGLLPPGLALDGFGILVGKPTQEGDFPFRVSARDGQGYSASMSYSLAVALPPPTPTPTPTSTPTPPPTAIPVERYPKVFWWDNRASVSVTDRWYDYSPNPPYSLLGPWEFYGYSGLNTHSYVNGSQGISEGTKYSQSMSRWTTPDGVQAWSSDPPNNVVIPPQLDGDVAIAVDTSTLPNASAARGSCSITAHVLKVDGALIIEGHVADALTFPAPRAQESVDGDTSTGVEIRFWLLDSNIQSATYEATWGCNLGYISLDRRDCQIGCTIGEYFIREGNEYAQNSIVQNCAGSSGELLQTGGESPYVFKVGTRVRSVTAGSNDTREGDFRLVVRAH